MLLQSDDKHFFKGVVIIDTVTNEPVPLVVKVDTKTGRAFCIKEGPDGKVLMENNRLLLFEYPNKVKVVLEKHRDQELT